MEKILSILAIILAVVAIGFVAFNQMNTPAVPSADEIASKVNVTIVSEVVNNSKLDELYEDYFEDKKELELKNDTAKELVLDEKSKKDFMLEVLKVLKAEGKDVDSYKDLEIYSFVIKSSEVSGEDAEVVAVFKVSGFEDDDEESDFKARFKAVFMVEELNADEDFEDAEVTLDSLVLEKFYE